MSHQEQNHHEHDQQTVQQIKQIVEEYGWYVALFEAEDSLPSFGYTIGLRKNFKHPEIIMFGLPVDVMGALLNLAGDKAKAGEVIKEDVLYEDMLTDLPVAFKGVHPDNMPDYFGYGMDFYEHKAFPALQLFWPDEQGAFPWENHFNKDLFLYQPLLVQRLDFKFSEPRNVAAFIDKRIFHENKPILYVVHDEEDGSWQFLTGEPVSEDDVIIVALEQVVKKDVTVNELFNLSMGQYATRTSIGDKWIRGENKG